MPSPICTVQDGAGAATATTNGVNITPANTITIALAGVASVTSWQISCVYTDETSSAAAINSALTVNATAKTATFTAPAAGKALIFQSTINGGLGPDGLPLASYTTTFGVFTLTAGGARVAAMNQTFEGDATYGWTGTFNYVVRNPSSGATPGGVDGDVQVKSGATLAGKTATTIGTSLLCTAANVVAFGAIPLATAAATTGQLPINKGGTALSAVPGTSGQLLFNSAGTAYGATSNVTYDGTGLVLNSSGFASFGTTPSTTGLVRFPYAGGSVLALLSVKNSSAADTPIIRTGAGDVVTFGNVGQDCSFVSTVNGFVSFGATPATAGQIRTAYNGGSGVVFWGVKDSTATDRAGITYGPGNAFTFGNSSMDSNVNGFNVTYTVASTFALTASGTVTVSAASKNALVADGTTLYLGTNAAFSAQHASIKGYTSTDVSFGLGSTTMFQMVSGGFYLQGAPVKLGTSLGGSDAAANLPFKFALAPINVTTSTTLTQAQYSCPILLFTGTPGAATTQTVPLISGAFWVVANITSQAMTFSGGSGATVSLAAGTAGIIFCDGTNMRRIT